MDSQILAGFIIFLLGVTLLRSSCGQQTTQQPTVHNINFNKPYKVNETIEVLNPGTPQEEVVVRGNRIVVYVVPGKDGAPQYAIKETNRYIADRNGYRVTTSYGMTLLGDLEDKIGPMALKGAAG